MTRRGGAAVLVVLAAALTIRLAFVLSTPRATLGFETADYHRHGASIAAGNGYPSSWITLIRAIVGVPSAGFVPTAHRAPLLPYMLGTVYRVTGTEEAGRQTARVVLALAGTGLVGLIGALAYRVRDAPVALVAMGMAAVYPPFVVYGTTMLTELPFAVLEVAAVLAVLAYRREQGFPWALVAGGLAGAATLTRPNGFVVLLAVVAGLSFTRGERRRALAAAGISAGVAVVLVAPWTLRNASAVGGFVPVTNGVGVALAGTYNDTARNDPDCRACWQLFDPAVLAVVTNPRLDEPAVDADLTGLALEYARQHAGYVPAASIWNTLRLAGLGGVGAEREVLHADVAAFPGWVAWTTVVGLAALAALAVAGAAAGGWRALPGFAWVAPGLSLAMAIPVISRARYRLPVDPFLIVVAAVAVVRTLMAIRARRRPVHPSPPS